MSELSSRSLIKLFLYFQPKPPPRAIWLLGSPKHISYARAPTNRMFLLRILQETHTRVAAKTAITHAIKEKVLPFYAAAYCPTSNMSAMHKKAFSLYHTYQQLTVALRAKGAKQCPDFKKRCNAFTAQLDDAFSVPPENMGKLTEDAQNIHTLLKVYVYFTNNQSIYHPIYQSVD